MTIPFTDRERRLIRRLRTPRQVQRFLNGLPYNTEPPPGRATLRSFRKVVRAETAHCLEAALSAAVILEQHGFPPLVMSLESIDKLDHVVFVYKQGESMGIGGPLRDPGLHGRKPVFKTARALALSYADPFVDFSGRLTGYAVVDLRVMGDYDWRLSEKNVWKVERMLLDYPHRHLRSADRHVDQLRARYVAFRQKYGDIKPVQYRGLGTWSELPPEANRGRNLAWVSPQAPGGPA